MQPSNEKSDWHRLGPAAVVQQLGTDISSGLSPAEAGRRLIEYGANELRAASRLSPWTIFFGQFRNVLIAILLVATALSIFLGHGAEAIAIALIVLFAVLLGFAQEYRSERALEALRQMAAPTATALRDGEEVVVPARGIVPGDVILLRSGDKVSADARLIQAVNLQIEEAAHLPVNPCRWKSKPSP
jgi:P-type Ca2+ transporter type 2C